MGADDFINPWIDQNVDPRISIGGMDQVPAPQPIAAPAGPNRATYDAAVGQNTGFIHDPGQLGWDEAATKRFNDAGINKLPTWFNKDTIYSDAFRLGGRDPVQNYIDLHNTPIEQAASQWDASKRAAGSLFSSTGVDPNAEGDAAKEAYLRTAFGQMNNAKDSWWDRNKGWAIPGMGFATIASMGALAPATAGATAGAEVGTESGLFGAGAFGGASELAGTSGVGLLDPAITAGIAGGADVGMGAGTSWLTDLGLPASYGNDLGALLSYGGDKMMNLDWGALANKNMLGSLLNGAMPVSGVVSGTGAGMPGGGTTSAPQTSPIQPGAPMNTGQPVAPATMPTGSIMSAFGNRDSGKDDYRKYFSTLF